jgi:hypothetical protein
VGEVHKVNEFTVDVPLHVVCLSVTVLDRVKGKETKGKSNREGKLRPRSAVGIATRYGPDGPGIEFRWEA